MSEEKKEAEFVDGLICKKPSPNAPKWVLFNISMKCEELINFIQSHSDESGWLNIDVKESKAGKIYCQLNTWKADKSKKKVEKEAEGPEIDGEDDGEIPF